MECNDKQAYKKLFGVLRSNGYAQTSLSLQKDSPAVEFYKSLGYRLTEEKFDHDGNENFIIVKEMNGVTSCEYQESNKR